jgi:hypothetical protein
MNRHIPGLEQTLSGKPQLVDGFYLVRVDRIAYRYDARRPHFWLHLAVIEPKLVRPGVPFQIVLF